MVFGFGLLLLYPHREFLHCYSSKYLSILPSHPRAILDSPPNHPNPSATCNTITTTVACRTIQSDPQVQLLPHRLYVMIRTRQTAPVTGYERVKLRIRIGGTTRKQRGQRDVQKFNQRTHSNTPSESNNLQHPCLDIFGVCLVRDARNYDLVFGSNALVLAIRLLLEQGRVEWAPELGNQPQRQGRGVHPS